MIKIVNYYIYGHVEYANDIFSIIEEKASSPNEQSLLMKPLMALAFAWFILWRVDLLGNLPGGAGRKVREMGSFSA